MNHAFFPLEMHIQPILLIFTFGKFPTSLLYVKMSRTDIVIIYIPLK